MKRITIIALMVLWCWGVVPVLADVTLTLDSALTLAATNNRSLKKASQEVLRAKAVRNEARSNYFPQVQLQGGAYHALDPLLEYSASDVPNASARDLLNTLYADYGVALGLPNSIALLQQTTVASAVAVQPVYMGGKIVAGNRLATVGTQAAELQAEITARDLMQSVEESYWLVVGLEEKQQTISSVQLLLDTVHYQVAKAIEAGVAMRSDLLTVELRQNEIAAQQLRLQNGIGLARRALAQSIGVAVDSLGTLQPVPTTDSILPAPTTDSVAQRPEHELLALQVKAEQLQKRMTLAETLPQIAVGATYSYVGFSSSNYKTDACALPSGAAWNGRRNGLLFVTVKIPLTDWWKTGHRLQQHNALIEEARLEQADLTEQMVLQEQQAYDAMTEAAAQIVRQQTSVRSAEENLRLSRLNYNAGLAGITELLQAQALLLQAENDLTDARIAWRVNAQRYRRLTQR
ncbi:MAG: TolC family protein [Paludibacteraceae bacterium]